MSTQTLLISTKTYYKHKLASLKTLPLKETLQLFVDNPDFSAGSDLGILLWGGARKILGPRPLLVGHAYFNEPHLPSLLLNQCSMFGQRHSYSSTSVITMDGIINITNRLMEGNFYS